MTGDGYCDFVLGHLHLRIPRYLVDDARRRLQYDPVSETTLRLHLNHSLMMAFGTLRPTAAEFSAMDGPIAKKINALMLALMVEGHHVHPVPVTN